MKLLIVSRFDRYARAISAITKYAKVGGELGHHIALFSDPIGDLPLAPTSLDPQAFDYVMFVVYETPDFPDLPYLAHLLDRVPWERRIIVDCTGRYNDTFQVELDFNHLEKMDNHMGWEWVDGFAAVAKTILQPTLRPRRGDARPFLFHGFDPTAVARRYQSADEAARDWAADSTQAKPYGMIYVGNNWQRWSQMRSLLEAIGPIQRKIGQICLTGWAWDYRPDWAAELDVEGINTDGAMLQRMGVEIRGNIPFDQVVPFVSQARFSPVIHRPLFNHLGIVTNRTFETFCSDTIPLLMLPEQMVESIYGRAALPLVLRDDVAGQICDIQSRPEVYWDAVLKTRAYLAERHSFERRLQELMAILES
ncbi:MAG: hypothetical protein J2P21_07810 [Chloracidobacterium sp.]|nr:hypothetical protein [Chloracidobacterium sp.]